MKILVFGNPLVEKDTLPIKLIPKLKKEFSGIEFKQFDAVEEIQEEGKSLYIIDAAAGIEKVQKITELSNLETKKVYSLHDFDLAHMLKLMKKTGIIEEVTIFAVPQKMNKQTAFEQLKKGIKAILRSKNG